MCSVNVCAMCVRYNRCDGCVSVSPVAKSRASSVALTASAAEPRCERRTKTTRTHTHTCRVLLLLLSPMMMKWARFNKYAICIYVRISQRYGERIQAATADFGPCMSACDGVSEWVCVGCVWMCLHGGLVLSPSNPLSFSRSPMRLSQHCCCCCAIHTRNAFYFSLGVCSLHALSLFHSLSLCILE